jgi:predicted GIY-YIG superfamily endonuclease
MRDSAAPHPAEDRPRTTNLATAVLEATFAADRATVYLLHFDQAYRHAKHYTGWTCDLPGRLADHASGHGARLTQVVRAAGIGWTLARTWPGPRSLERALKRQGGASRRCPLCTAESLPCPPRRKGSSRHAEISNSTTATRRPEGACHVS